MIWLTDRARDALSDGEVVVFDWAPLGVCCGCTGETWLRPARRTLVRRYQGYRAVAAQPEGSVVAHPLARPYLVGTDVVVDCRHRFGLRRFTSDLPAGLALQAAFGRPRSTSTARASDDNSVADNAVGDNAVADNAVGDNAVDGNAVDTAGGLV